MSKYHGISGKIVRRSSTIVIVFWFCFFHFKDKKYNEKGLKVFMNRQVK